MDTLRRRVPFKVREEEGEDEHILDEQEQEEVITKLRKENADSNAQYRLVMQLLLGLSMFMQLGYLFTPSKISPLLTIFPVSGATPTPLPLSSVLTLLSIALHMNLLLMCRSPLLYSTKINAPRPLPFDLTYALAAVAPTLALFLQKPWQVTTWWCLTPGIVFITQTVLESIELGNHSVAELEAMKYRSVGA